MKRTFHPVWFVVLWLILNLIQAYRTELTSDEGYYWLYAHHLEWGYYDHPPMVALLVNAGYFFFPNELGVRLFNILLNSWAVWIFLHLLPAENRKKIPVLYCLLAMPLFHYLSFIIFPDGPLLFCIAAYLWCYKKFIERNTLQITILLGFIMSLMLYSKYHAVLVIAFTVLSNLQLLKNKYFYAAVFVAAILFVPHLVWQYQHGFITFQYHLQQREAASSSNRVFEYLSQQVLAIGPGLIFIPFVYKIKGQFERTLLFIALGTLAFFLVISINTFVHFHWTSIVIFPLLYMAIKYYDNKNRRLMLWLLLPFCFLNFLFRLQLIYQVFPINHAGVDYYHGRKEWAAEIKELAGNSPVIFENNFRESSLYEFYSGETGIALFSGENRKTQYDLWHFEESAQNKTVFLFKRDSFPGCIALPTSLGKPYYYTQISQLHSFYNIPLHTNFPKVVSENNKIETGIVVNNPRPISLTFTGNKPGSSTVLFYRITGENKIVDNDLMDLSAEDAILPGGIKLIKTTIDLFNLGKGKYNIAFGFRNSPLQDSFNDAYNFTIK